MALLLSDYGGTGLAAEFDQGPILSVTEENDLVNGTDRWYTQGAKIAFLQGDNHVPSWVTSLLDHIPTLGFSTGAERLGYQLGQSVFTPENTHSSQLQLEDRPYAGWLYTGLILQRRGLGVGDHLTLENFQIDLGIIGPESQADQLQTWYHDRAPRGWEHQIKNEPGLAIKYGRSWLIPLPSEDRRFFDMLPQAGLSVGNVDTSFRAGGTFRLGWNLPEDFGVQTIDALITTEGGWSPSRKSNRWGFYVFSGLEGRAVPYNAFLDGNAFRESHHVDREPFVGEWRSGLVLVLNRVEIAYTHVFRSREFEEQDETHSFGSLSLKYKF